MAMTSGLVRHGRWPASNYGKTLQTVVQIGMVNLPLAMLRLKDYLTPFLDMLGDATEHMIYGIEMEEPSDQDKHLL